MCNARKLYSGLTIEVRKSSASKAKPESGTAEHMVPRFTTAAAMM